VVSVCEEAVERERSSGGCGHRGVQCAIGLCPRRSQARVRIRRTPLRAGRALLRSLFRLPPGDSLALYSRFAELSLVECFVWAPSRWSAGGGTRVASSSALCTDGPQWGGGRSAGDERPPSPEARGRALIVNDVDGCDPRSLLAEVSAPEPTHQNDGAVFADPQKARLEGDAAAPVTSNCSC
jgi:hypothetical protein